MSASRCGHESPGATMVASSRRIAAVRRTVPSFKPLTAGQIDGPAWLGLHAGWS